MLTGRPPFAGETTADVLGALLHKEPAPLTEVAPDTPRGLQRVVGKALRKDREERYQTAKDLLVDLRQLKKQTEAGAQLERTKHTPEGTDGKQEHATQTFTARPTSTAECSGRIRNHNLCRCPVICGGWRIGFWYSMIGFTSSQIESMRLTVYQRDRNPSKNFRTDDESLITPSQLPKLSVQGGSFVFRYKVRSGPQQVGGLAGSI